MNEVISEETFSCKWAKFSLWASHEWKWCKQREIFAPLIFFSTWSRGKCSEKFSSLFSRFCICIDLVNSQHFWTHAELLFFTRLIFMKLNTTLKSSEGKLTSDIVHNCKKQKIFNSWNLLSIKCELEMWEWLDASRLSKQTCATCDSQGR